MRSAVFPFALEQMPAPKHYSYDDVQSILSLLKVITNRSELITIFYSVLEGGSDYDKFAKAIISYSKSARTTMRVLQKVVDSEFEANLGTPTSIMRGNTAASRILGLYCREEGNKYLQRTLSPALTSIIGGSMDFEINECNIEECTPEKISNNLENLLSFATRVLETINTPESILEMPRQIKALAYHIQQLAIKHAPGNTMLLVGGFIMLRFINPALLAPDFFNLVPSGSLTPKDRRNLTLLCKLVQNISNQRECNEEWMLNCNPFIQKHMESLEEFYVHVLMDPEQENEELEEFGDLFTSVADERDANPDDIDLESIRFFDETFREHKSDLMDLLSEQGQEFCMQKDIRVLVELLNDYGESSPAEPEAESSLELYYSPLCPFSRAVSLFCQETQIPIVLHKIDLLKEDQALDKTYKNFERLSPSLQTPLLIDGDFVIEESDAICLYLCDKYYVGPHWYSKSNLCDAAIIHQQLDWMHAALQSPLVRIWEATKNPTAANLQLENYSDLVENLQLLNTMYEKQSSRCGSNRFSFFHGKNPGLVDLFTVITISFCHLITGFAISNMYFLSRAYSAFVNQSAKQSWTEINYEFEGFLKYIINVTSTGTVQQIKHSVLFQQPPLTIYEMIQDPENDIFLFLASKTISMKTNAKLKRGLKKLDGAAAEQGDQLETNELPYSVNLDIGGEFNIRGREGTNLLLVPGKKIVQTSRFHTWAKGYSSTVIFEFEAVRTDQAVLHFTELNCPTEFRRAQEENWSKFWKNINGVRVDTIDQTIVIKTKGPSMLFNVLVDPKLLAKTLKSKVKIEEDGGCYMHSNKVYTKLISTVPNKQIEQEWRGTDWPEDHFGHVIQDLESHEGGSRIRCRIQWVPFEKIKAVEKLWKSSMWKKLGGIVCGSFSQTVAFTIPPAEVCSLWLDGNLLSLKLKSKCVADKEVGSHFSAQHLKGSLKYYEEDKKMILNVAHKDWPNHNSLVTMNLLAIENGTEIRLSHENIPLTFLKPTTDMWALDFWAKMEAIPTTNISASCILNMVPRKRVYAALLKSEVLTKIVGEDCSISPTLGGNVRMYDNLIKGIIKQLDENCSIVLSVRYFSWHAGHYSELVYQLDEMNGGKGTLFTLQQNRVPVDQSEEVHKRVETFCDLLRKAKLPK